MTPRSSTLRLRFGQSLIFFTQVVIPLGITCSLLAEVPKEVAPVEKPIQFAQPQLHIQLLQTTQFIRAGEARTLFKVDGAGLTAAVLDTGIRATHVDFSGRIAATRNFTTDSSGNVNDADDKNGHGTNVAGIIAANADHIGIAPGAKIVALKVLQNDGNGSFDSINNALQWVIDNHASQGITVVNMSLGAPTNDTDDASLNADQVVAKIRQLRSINIPVVIAAGNDYYRFKAEGMGYPAIAKESVSVGAVYDANVGPFSYQSGAVALSTGPGRFCPFSQRLHASTNQSCKTDIFSPGAPITSSGIQSDNGESIDHGTSQATPVTVGTILLMQQFHRQSTGKLPSVDDIETWLRNSGVEVNDGDDEDDNVPHSNKKYTRLDALSALQAVRQDLTMQLLIQKQPALQLQTSPEAKKTFRANMLDK